MATRIVVMSDIHGNLPALEAVVAALPDCDQVIVAGDICLEGPCPAEVLDLLGSLGWTLIVGNTDCDIVSPPPDAKPEKAELIQWTRRRLGPERLELLRRLPFSHRVEIGGAESLLVVHANPLNMEDQLRPSMPDDQIRPYVERADASVVAFGHLHIPYVRPVDGVLLVDVASVGHPKDRDRRSAFTVLEWRQGMRSVTQARVTYDVERTTRLVRERMPQAEEQIDALLRASY